MSDQIKISIVVPFYNAEKHIKNQYANKMATIHPKFLFKTSKKDKKDPIILEQKLCSKRKNNIDLFFKKQ